MSTNANSTLIDTLDLQDQNAPSAQDHTTQNVIPVALEGGIAPHQELSIRHADQDSREEIMHGPGMEDINGYGDGIDMDDESEDPDERHNDLGDSEDGDLTDGEGDDLLDDDMDKISSSPSIDDGTLYLLCDAYVLWSFIPNKVLQHPRNFGLFFATQKISISSLSMRSITLSLLWRGKPTQQREILWSSSMTVIPTGGSCEL